MKTITMGHAMQVRFYKVKGLWRAKVKAEKGARFVTFRDWDAAIGEARTITELKKAINAANWSNGSYVF